MQERSVTWNEPDQEIPIGQTFITGQGDGPRATVISRSNFRERRPNDTGKATGQQMLYCRVRKGNYPPKLFSPTAVSFAVACELEAKSRAARDTHHLEPAHA